MRIVGIILAAGYGTRFLPFTRVVPKELLPLGTVPALWHVVDELVASGIREIVVVTSRRKRSVEDLFDTDVELECYLAAQGKDPALARPSLPPDVRVSFVRQSQMKGTGDAVLLARNVVGEAACVVAYPDDVHFPTTKAPDPLAKQLSDIYLHTGCSVIALEALSATVDIARFGVADPEWGTEPLVVRSVVEKPSPGTEPSRYAVIGRYLLNTACLEELQKLRLAHTSGELFLTDALNQQAMVGILRGCIYSGTTFDLGEPIEYLKAQLRYALEVDHHPGLLDALRKLIGV